MKRSIFVVLFVLLSGLLFVAYQNAGTCNPEWETSKTLEGASAKVLNCEVEGETVIWEDASGPFSRPTFEVIDEGVGQRHVRVYTCDGLHQLKFEVRLEQLKPGCQVASSAP